MGIYVVERSVASEDVPSLAGSLERFGAECARTSVQYLHGTYVADRQLVLCVVRAPDAPAVAAAVRLAGLAGARILSAVYFGQPSARRAVAAVTEPAVQT